LFAVALFNSETGDQSSSTPTTSGNKTSLTLLKQMELMYLAGLSVREIMKRRKMLNYIKEVLENMPTGWLSITTHRLDIYDEKNYKNAVRAV
jgi:hypothetical protein